MDDKDLGNTLVKILSIIGSYDEISANEIDKFTGEFCESELLPMFRALEKRKYICCPNLVNGPEYGIITYHDKVRITIEGINYLELSQNKWQQFKLRAVYIPLVIALITSVVTNLIIPFFKN